MPAKGPVNDHNLPALKLELGSEFVELRHLVSAASTFAGLVHEVSRAMTKDEHAIVWTVAVEAGSVVLPVRPHGDSKTQAALLETISSGIALIEEAAERPPYFTDHALAQARHLANLASDELPVRVRNGTTRPIALTKRLVANVEVLTRPPQARIGTIEGYLQEANVDGRPTFQVRERLSGDKVQCKAGDGITVEELGRALGKRVEVRGRIRPARPGQAMMLEVKDLHVFHAEEDLPSADDVRGILKPAS